LVAAICDRRSGVGGDGVLRVVRTVHSDEVGVAAQADRAEWFMDYRNADGSIAEMCGNGVRVFVRYLLDAGLADRPVVHVATRAGVTAVTIEHDGTLAAELGPAAMPEVRPSPSVTIDPVGWPAVSVTMPNPHAVVFVHDLAVAGDLMQAPVVGPLDAFPDGANVEFVVIEEPGHLSMRVFERGVGETASCGTGACAVVVAARRRLAPPDGAGVVERWTVDVPGGQLRVTERPDGRVELAGPAVLVSSGVLRPEWVEAHC
jgi:diaminopimelate epimerase